LQLAAAILLSALTIQAQGPIRVEYACPPEDIDSFGLACSTEDVCQVFLELSGVQAVGGRLFLTGNLHTASTTLYSILLMSEDAGKTWTEPHRRLRATTLEQIQFLDFEHGWIAGHLIEPLPKDPFILLSTDGGKTWRQRPLFEESRFGSIASFWFDAPSTGELLFDRSQGAASKYELYESMTGGESWTPRETSSKPIRLKKAPVKEDSAWRVRADGPTKSYRVERGMGGNRETIASFIIHVADCQ
jgi:photosystem II stability/assembly factor-like uncharacterized protein